MEADITFCQVVASCSLDRTVERVDAASPTSSRPYAFRVADARPSVRVRVAD